MEHKLKQHNQQLSVQSAMISLILSKFTDPSIILLILFFLPCREKAHDSNKFRCENSKPHCESRIMNHNPSSRTLYQKVNFIKRL